MTNNFLDFELHETNLVTKGFMISEPQNCSRSESEDENSKNNINVILFT